MIQHHDLDFSKCAGCPVQGAKFVPADGAPGCTCFVVGTAPGATDEQLGRAFSGVAGQTLRNVFDGLGIQPFYTNVLKRRPEGKVTRQECWRCGLHLIEEMKRAKVTHVLSLGAVPFKFLYGMQDMSLPEVHGLPMQLDRFGMEFTLVPTFDPGHVLRRGGVLSKVGEEWLADIEEYVRVMS